jgi:hypothetical protein
MMNLPSKQKSSDNEGGISDQNSTKGAKLVYNDDDKGTTE